MPRVLDIPGSPQAEHQRSRAARRVARLAASSNLLFSNYEHRAGLAWPTAWLATGAAEPPPRFVAGVLAEPKYQAFRHDLMIASFHPGHRAQWTAHELCHGLVGFAYRPGAQPLFHTFAAWLAELVPVALWYFFDEADVRKCEAHRGSGPLFQQHCEACELAALAGPRTWDEQSEQRQREGRRYIDAELAAFARSRKRGRPRGTRYATIDLAQDSLSYAASHRARLAAPEMERFTAQFFAPHQGLHHDLDALEQRVVEMADYLCGGKQPKAWRATHWDYAAQDVGYRLLTVRAQASEGAAHELDGLIDALASDRSEAGMARAIEGYRALVQDNRRARHSRLVPSELVFAVGYALPLGEGHDYEQLSEGVASACPSTWAALKREQSALVRSFAEHDAPVRQPLGQRFAHYLVQHASPSVSELARIEAAITHAPPRDLVARSLGSEPSRDGLFELAADVQVIEAAYDVLGLTPGRVARAKRRTEPYALLVLRSSEGEVDILEVNAQLGRQLRDSGTIPVRVRDDDAHASTLLELQRAGVLVPRSYAE